MANGVVLSRTEAAVTLQCDESAARIDTGAKVVLTFGGGNERWTGLVEQVAAAANGVQIRLVTPNAHAADKRDYPRLHAGIPLRYRIATDEEGTLWIAGADLESGWQTPDPYMNFSVSGLRFEVTDQVQEEQLLLIELRIGESAKEWRATARVIRVFEGQNGDHSSAAVSFEHLPTDALAALSDLTLQIQDTLL